MKLPNPTCPDIDYVKETLADILATYDDVLCDSEKKWINNSLEILESLRDDNLTLRNAVTELQEELDRL